MARAAIVKFEIENMGEFLRELDRLGLKADEGMSFALRAEAERIMQRSKSQVPVDTGKLKSTAHIGIPHRVPGGVAIEYGYGGPAARYAIYQHYGNYEHPQGGKAHFLDEPTRWARRGLTARVRTVLDRYFRR